VTRWNRRLLAGAIAVMVPALAGCEAGLNAPTLEYHPAANGVSIVKNDITIDNVFVLGGPVGSSVPAGGRAGVFLALDSTDGDRLVSITASGAASGVSITGGSVNLPQQSLVSLEGPKPQIVLTGLTSPLVGGQTVQLVLNFAEAGPITITAPVEPRAYDYATYSPPTTPAPKPKKTAKAKPGATATPTGTATAGASATASPTPTP
jgi:copper(I)-binding protein